MPRYVRLARPAKAYRDDWDGVEPAAREVQVCDHEYVDTGLMFADGSPIMKAPTPIGFGRDDEW